MRLARRTRAVTSLLAALLYGVAPLDPVPFIGSAVLLLLVGAGASYIPAGRAARTDPWVVLTE